MSDAERPMRDTQFGLLRRTGPASAELIDPNTGAVYGLNFAALADGFVGPDQGGRELADEIFDDSGEGQ